MIHQLTGWGDLSERIQIALLEFTSARRGVEMGRGQTGESQNSRLLKGKADPYSVMREIAEVVASVKDRAKGNPWKKTTKKLETGFVSSFLAVRH